MLQKLSDTTHRVISGVALLWGEREIADFDSTGVRFAKMSEAEIDWYVASGEPSDKAGAYAVQGLASMFIKGLDGDYFNVVGLPVNLLAKTLKESYGIDLVV
jgi:septum formation protein